MSDVNFQVFPSLKLRESYVALAFPQLQRLEVSTSYSFCQHQWWCSLWFLCELLFVFALTLYLHLYSYLCLYLYLYIKRESCCSSLMFPQLQQVEVSTSYSFCLNLWWLMMVTDMSYFNFFNKPHFKLVLLSYIIVICYLWSLVHLSPGTGACLGPLTLSLALVKYVAKFWIYYPQ